MTFADYIFPLMLLALMLSLVVASVLSRSREWVVVAHDHPALQRVREIPVTQWRAKSLRTGWTMVFMDGWPALIRADADYDSNRKAYMVTVSINRVLRKGIHLKYYASTSFEPVTEARELVYKKDREARAALEEKTHQKLAQLAKSNIQ